jgi:hypothetical protein
VLRGVGARAWLRRAEKGGFRAEQQVEEAWERVVRGGEEDGETEGEEGRRREEEEAAAAIGSGFGGWRERLGRRRAWHGGRDGGAGTRPAAWLAGGELGPRRGRSASPASPDV